ncbi:MAG TPA: hypothetical protein VEJ16_09535 [Alphaproteobacteria bacterium]|nr:hypothetical protein [Alphaproteobacteria bacterium]
MTAFPASVAAGLLLAFWASGAAAADTNVAQGAPIQLLPLKPSSQLPEQGLATEGAGSQAPLSPQVPTATPAAAPIGVASPKGIEVDKLGGFDNDALGTLDPGQGGLGLDLWRGTPHSTVTTLIAAMPSSIRSPVLRDLAHRLLLSNANRPEGVKREGASAGAADDSGASLIALRAQKLGEMGDLDGLKSLMAVIPASFDDETLARLRTNASLIDGAPADVCRDAGSLLRKYPGVYWQKLQLFCEASEKKTQQVDIGVSLLHEEGEDKDPSYFMLLNAVMGEKGVRLTALPNVTPLHFAMMRAAKIQLREDALRVAEPAVLRAIAENPDTPPDLRLAAAERATLAGAMSGDRLAQIYDKANLTDADGAGAAGKADTDYGPKTRVRLYRAAKDAQVPTAKAEAIGTALSLARSAGVYPLAIAVNLPLIEAMAPAPELAFFAPEAARALFYAGRVNAAQNWVAIAPKAVGAGSTLLDAAVELWPYTCLAMESSTPWDENRFSAWRAAQVARKDAPAKLADERAAQLLGLFAALGNPVPRTSWQSLLGSTEDEPAAMPPIAVWQALKFAAADSRRGETVLLVLIAAGAGGAGSTNPVALDASVEALRKVGLAPEARRLAIEAAVAAGV